MTDKSYSVVIPARNASAFIAEAIGSLCGQTLPPHRIIVVDDGSTDDTAAIASACGDMVEVLSQPATGPGAATSRGIEAAQTPFLAFLDADDLWLPEKAERQLAAFESRPDLQGVFCHMAKFSGSPQSADLSNAHESWLRSTMFLRLDTARAVGAMIDPPGGIGDIVDWVGRLREATQDLVMLSEVLALRRIHEGSLTYSMTASDQKGYLHVARAALLRRRARNADQGEGDT